jgi:tRNA1Val (adenine37-N6)-methyltransferase
MSNNYFQFKRFVVRQERCAMKVGTDGTLLGAWARGGQRVLDIGTGTGLIALMMAQRCPDALVTAVDIDADAVRQARENVAESSFAERITVVEGDINTLTIPNSGNHISHLSPLIYHFDAIVCNPPYFNDSLTCPDEQRTTARHTTTLTYRELMAAVARLLSDDGEFSVVIPFDCKARLEAEAALAGLSKTRECSIRTTPRKAPRRFLLAFRKHPEAVETTEGVLETEPGQRSDWYHALTNDFYL